MWQNMLKDFCPKAIFIFLLLMSAVATESFPVDLKPFDNKSGENLQNDFHEDFTGEQENFTISEDFETWLNENLDGLESGNPVYEDGKLTSISFFSNGVEIYKENYYYDKKGNPIMSKITFLDGDNTRFSMGKVSVSDGAVSRVSYSNYFTKDENPLSESSVINYDFKSRETENYVFRNGILTELKKTEYLSEEKYPSVETTDYYSDDSTLIKQIVSTRNSQGLKETETTEFPLENKKNMTLYTYSGNSNLKERIDIFYENNVQIKKSKIEYEYSKDNLKKEICYENDKLVSEINYINENEYEKIIYRNNKPVLKAIYSSGKKIQETIYKNDNTSQVRY